MRIVFLGTGDIGLPSLEALFHSSACEVVAVVTQPDKPVGRKQLLTSPEVKMRALAAGVPVLQPPRIRQAVEELAALNADVFVVVAYGQILPSAVLALPKNGCLNIHASLLPRHRGASPIQAAIREGDAESGITIMWMDEGLDTGDILLQDKLTIGTDETGASLHDRLATLAPHSLARALTLIEQGTASHIPQHHASSTHCRKLEREHGHLDWQCSAVELERLIRAYTPWPGTYSLIPLAGGKMIQLKIHHAKVVDAAEACPTGGTVISANEQLLVATGSGLLELVEVQLEGRKRMSAGDFLRGFPLEVGVRLS